MEKDLNPSVVFQLNQDLDVQVGTMFLDHKKAGIDFGGGIIRHHPALAGALQVEGEKRKKIVEDYVRGFYKDYEKELENTKARYQEAWNNVQKDFFKVTSMVFGDHCWPIGAYVGYLSIFNCNPRFLDTKTFQVYYQHRAGVVSVTAHEMLHFIFYDWLEKHAPELITKIGEEKVWKLSEVFDIVAFDRQEFAKFKPKKSGGYPDLQPIAGKITEELKNNPFTVNSFLSIAKKSI